jgi:hypothetical protein
VATDCWIAAAVARTHEIRRRSLLLRQRHGATGSDQLVRRRKILLRLDGCGNENKMAVGGRRDRARASERGWKSPEKTRRQEAARDRVCPQIFPAQHVAAPPGHASASWRERRANRRPRTRVRFLRPAGPVEEGWKSRRGRTPSCQLAAPPRARSRRRRQVGSIVPRA